MCSCSKSLKLALGVMTCNQYCFVLKCGGTTDDGVRIPGTNPKQ